MNFYLGGRNGFFKWHSLFFPLEDKLIFSLPWKKTKFFPLEDELDFSKSIPLDFFTWKTDKLNFSLGRQTEFFKGYTFEFFSLKDKLNFSKGNVNINGSPFYLATTQFQKLLAFQRDDVLGTLCHSCVFRLSAEGGKNISWPYLRYEVWLV